MVSKSGMLSWEAVLLDCFPWLSAELRYSGIWGYAEASRIEQPYLLYALSPYLAILACLFCVISNPAGMIIHTEKKKKKARFAIHWHHACVLIFALWLFLGRVFCRRWQNRYLIKVDPLLFGPCSCKWILWPYSRGNMTLV